MIGTPLYMAPEQAVGARAIDARADLYPIGVMLYRMITGQLPGLGFARPGGLAARKTAGPPDPRHVCTLPDALAELIMACMSFAPEGRPRAASELADALRSWAEVEEGGLFGLGRGQRQSEHTGCQQSYGDPGHDILPCR